MQSKRNLSCVHVQNALPVYQKEVVPYIHKEFEVESLRKFSIVAHGDNRSESDKK